MFDKKIDCNKIIQIYLKKTLKNALANTIRIKCIGEKIQ